jgi:deoxyribose-phosphate aldolase
MLTIQNFKKIQNQWYGDWQIGRTDEGKQYYALQARHKNGRDTITCVIFREGVLNTEWSEVTYDIKLMQDSTGDVIEDIVYKNTLEDMELFGEALVHYLNTI